MRTCGLLLVLLVAGLASAGEPGTAPRPLVTALLLLVNDAGNEVAPGLGLGSTISARVILVTAGEGPAEDAIIALQAAPTLMGSALPTGLVTATLQAPAAGSDTWLLLSAQARPEPSASAAALPDDHTFRTRLRDLLLGAEAFSASTPLPQPEHIEDTTPTPAPSASAPPARGFIPAGPTAVARVVQRRDNRVLLELVEGRAAVGAALWGLDPNAISVTVLASDGRFVLVDNAPADMSRFVLLRQAAP
jgi:hypothetical protein